MMIQLPRSASSLVWMAAVVFPLSAVAQTAGDGGRPSTPVPARPLLSGVGGVGLVSGGEHEILGRAALESGLGGRWRVRVAAEGWLGTGDCVTGAPEGSSDLCDASADGWSLTAGPALAAGLGGARLLVAPALGVANADGTRFLGGLALAFDPAPAAPVGLRIEAAYARLFGSARPSRVTVGAGVRVGL